MIDTPCFFLFFGGGVFAVREYSIDP